MRVWLEPPRGPRGGKIGKGHALDITTTDDLRGIWELDRRGFTFRVDGKATSPGEVAAAALNEMSIPATRDVVVGYHNGSFLVERIDGRAVVVDTARDVLAILEEDGAVLCLKRGGPVVTHVVWEGLPRFVSSSPSPTGATP